MIKITWRRRWTRALLVAAALAGFLLLDDPLAGRLAAFLTLAAALKDYVRSDEQDE